MFMEWMSEEHAYRDEGQSGNFKSFGMTRLFRMAGAAEDEDEG